MGEEVSSVQWAVGREESEEVAFSFASQSLFIFAFIRIHSRFNSQDAPVDWFFSASQLPKTSPRTTVG
jgi:hypothetical protein